MNLDKVVFLSIFISGLFLSSQNSHAQSSSIPGANYLGKSVNLLKGESRPGSRALLQTLTNAEIDRLGKGSGELKAEKTIAEDISEAEKNYSLEMGVEGSYGAFSAKADMNLEKEVKERTKTKIIMITKDLVSDELSIKSRQYKLNREFEAALNNPSKSPKDLFDYYGTHVTLAVLVGGRVTGIYSSRENTKESNKSLEASAEASYNGVVSGKASTKYSQSQSNRSSRTRINENFIVKGGISSNKVALEAKKSSKAYIDWARSVDSHPGFFAFKELMPIWDLASSPSRKKELKEGFEILFTKKSLINLQRFVHQSEEKTQRSTETMRIPEGYKILSGGARMHVEDKETGNLLTGSYPANETTWVGKHVDHTHADKSYISLYVMAVYDPFDRLDVIISEDSSNEGQKLKGVSMRNLDKSYVLTGGGANAEHTRGAPNMLTGSFPEFNSGSWTSKSMDLLQGGFAKLITYAIYVKFKANGAYTLESKAWHISSSSAGKPSLNMGVGSSRYHFVGGGAYTKSSLGENTHNFLTASYPEGRKWYAKSKDHVVARPAILTVFAIGLRVIEK